MISFSPTLISNSASNDVKYGSAHGAPDCERCPDNSCDSTEKTSESMSDSSNAASPCIPRRSSLKADGSQRRASLQTSEEENLSPGKEQPTKRSLTISFSESVQIKCVVAALQIARKPGDLWYQEKEYARIQRKITNVTDRIIAGHNAPKKSCLHGLDRLVKADERWERRCRAWDCVLNEQDFQRSNGACDSQMMAELYLSETEDAKLEALRSAERGAAEVQSYFARSIQC